MKREQRPKIIQVTKVCFSYGEKDVLKNVSFEAEPGEFLGIIGPNGAGKTTLLKMLNCLLKPQRGRLLIDGRPAVTLSPRQMARAVAFVPQEFNVVYPFRVSEIVLMGRHPHLSGLLTHEKSEDLEVARHAMRITDCLYLADKYFNELSGGEKQRVIIAAALAQKPRVLLLDEPTSNLDLKHQTLIYELLKELQKSESLTIVCATHDLNLAARYTDRLLLLKNGRTVKLASPRDVLRKSTLEGVYETTLTVGHHPGDGTVYVLPQAKKKGAAKK